MNFDHSSKSLHGAFMLSDSDAKQTMHIVLYETLKHDMRMNGELYDNMEDAPEEAKKISIILESCLNDCQTDQQRAFLLMHFLGRYSDTKRMIHVSQNMSDVVTGEKEGGLGYMLKKALLNGLMQSQGFDIEAFRKRENFVKQSKNFTEYWERYLQSRENGTDEIDDLILKALSGGTEDDISGDIE